MLAVIFTVVSRNIVGESTFGSDCSFTGITGTVRYDSTNRYEFHLPFVRANCFACRTTKSDLYWLALNFTEMKIDVIVFKQNLPFYIRTSTPLFLSRIKLENETILLKYILLYSRSKLILHCDKKTIMAYGIMIVSLGEIRLFYAFLSFPSQNVICRLALQYRTSLSIPSFYESFI